LDLAISTLGANSLTFTNNGSGVFAAGPILLSESTDIAMADLDGRGDLDFVLTRFGGDGLVRLSFIPTSILNFGAPGTNSVDELKVMTGMAPFGPTQIVPVATVDNRMNTLGGGSLTIKLSGPDVKFSDGIRVSGGTILNTGGVLSIAGRDIATISPATGFVTAATFGQTLTLTLAFDQNPPDQAEVQLLVRQILFNSDFGKGTVNVDVTLDNNLGIVNTRRAKVTIP
jgi:hypothetical protein